MKFTHHSWRFIEGQTICDYYRTFDKGGYRTFDKEGGLIIKRKLHYHQTTVILEDLTCPDHWKSSMSTQAYLWYIFLYFDLKAILRLFIYKALYDQSYLGSKTTMTTGEWSCLISFAWDPLTCSERRGGSEKFKMKIYVSSGIRTHASPRHD